MDNAKTFSSIIQNYFYQRLISQRNLSNQTVKSYRDTFRLLFKFSAQQGKAVPQLRLTDLNADFITKFLGYLETERGCTVRSRNTRLAAIRSFMHYASYQEPTALPIIQQVLTIPMKRFDRPLIGFLSRKEINAIIASPDAYTWSGQRDRVLLTTLYNTGARVSEIIALCRCDVEMDHTAVIHLHGKGRKERIIPLWKNTTSLIKQWMNNIEKSSTTPLFPNHFGKSMTRSGVENRLKVAVKKAELVCPSLKKRKVSPHVIRHTTAMHLLQSGVDITVIALWLGHESITTTHHYVEADLQMKKQALSTLQETTTKNRKPIPDKLLSFLESL
jgi:site-specific recombinase XerD